MLKLKSILIVLILTLITTSSVFSAVVPYGEELRNAPSTRYNIQFSDVDSSHWAYNYIGEMVARKVVNGYPDNTFLPDKTVTRAEMAKIIVMSAGLKPEKVNYSSFSDIKSSDWQSPYVETAKNYLTGYRTANGDYIYNPDAPALREDITIALVKLKGYDIRLADWSILEAMFTDYLGISEAARDYISIAVESGLVSGYKDRTFRAQSPITRAEAVALLWRAFQYGSDNKTPGDSSNTNTSTNKNTSETNNVSVSTNVNTPSTIEESETQSPPAVQKNTEQPYEQEYPFTIETLVGGIRSEIIDGSVRNAAVKDAYSLTYDNNENNVYFIDGGKVRKLDITNGVVGTIPYSDSQVIVYNNESIRIHEITMECIYYSNKDDKVYVYGFNRRRDEEHKMKGNFLLKYNIVGNSMEYAGCLSVSDWIDDNYPNMPRTDWRGEVIVPFFACQNNNGEMFLSCKYKDFIDKSDIKDIVLISESNGDFKFEGGLLRGTWAGLLNSKYAYNSKMTTGLYVYNDCFYSFLNNKLFEVKLFPRNIIEHNIITGNIQSSALLSTIKYIIYDGYDFFKISPTGETEIYIKKDDIKYLDGNKFENIFEMCVDSNGNIIFFDSLNSSLRRININI